MLPFSYVPRRLCSQEVGKNALLNVKIDRQDVAAGLYHVPVDRGPKTPPPAPAELTHLLKSWQYQATGKLGAAQVLHEMGAIHIKHGEWTRGLKRALDPGHPSCITLVCRAVSRAHAYHSIFYVICYYAALLPA